MILEKYAIQIVKKNCHHSQYPEIRNYNFSLLVFSQNSPTGENFMIAPCSVNIHMIN